MRPHHGAIVFILAAAALTPRYALSQQSRTTLDSTIVGLERRGWEALKRKDAAAFVKIFGPSFLYIQPTGASRITQASAADAIASCETRSYAMDSITVTPVGDNGAVLTYRVTLDQTCGGGQPEPSPQYSMEVWTRRNGQWQVVSRSDMPVRQAGAK
jgi:hypothetical protein